MQDQARAILKEGHKDREIEFIADVNGLLGPDGDPRLTKHEPEYEELWKTNPELALEYDSKAKVPTAYKILYSLLHKKHYYGGGGGGGGREEEEKQEEPPTVITPVTPENDYYSQLGVNENATGREIEVAYNKGLKLLNLDELERSLKERGVPDSEVQEQLKQAKMAYEYYQEANEALGNEEKRRYYDEFRRKSQGAPGQSKSAHYYAALGLTDAASQTDIKNAYRKLQKELHPDLIDKDFREGKISQEEYNRRGELLRDINEAYREVFKREKYNQERQDRDAKKEPEKPPDESKPQGQGPEVEKASKKLEAPTTFELRPGITNYDVFAVPTKEDLPAQAGKKTYHLVWQDKAGNIYTETVDERAKRTDKEEPKSQQKVETPEGYENFKKGFVEKLEKGDLKVESGLYFSLDSEGNPILAGGEKAPERIYLTFTPTVEESEETKKARDREDVKEHLKHVEDSGHFDLDLVTRNELEAARVISKEFNGVEFTTALRIYFQGGRSDDLIDKVAKAKFLTPEEKESFFISSDIIASLEESEKELTKNLQLAFRHPEITIEQVAPKIPSPPFQTLTLERKQEILSPIVKTAVGETVGVAKSQVKKLVVQSLKTEGKKTVTKVAVKTGSKVLANLAASAVTGVATGGIGTAVTIAIKAAGIVLSVIKKAVSIIPKLLGEEDRGNGYMVMGALIMLGGIVLPSLAVTLVGGVVFGSSFLSTVGVAGAGTQAVGFVHSMILGLVYTVAPIFTKAVIIVLITVLLLFIFIILIINNSAFVVPPHQTFAPFGGPLTNPYVGVFKEANPSGPLANNQTYTVTYTVTITALQGTLTNISFSNTCSVYASYTRNCQDLETNIQAGPQSGPLQSFPSIAAAAPQQISATQPYLVSYEVPYTGGQFNDSLISDTFTVTATEPSGTSQTSLGVVSVIIGSPPSSCFVISDNASSWNSSAVVSGYKNNLQRAINRLVTRYPVFVSKVCSGGTVNLCYNPPAVAAWGYHSHSATCDISFDSGGLTREDNATYILTHEASHHLDAIDGSWMSRYINSGAPTLEPPPLCSYPSAGSNQNESFAEGNALYVQLPSFWASRCGNTTFQSRYPRHYNFADTVVFR